METTEKEVAPVVVENVETTVMEQEIGTAQVRPEYAPLEAEVVITRRESATIVRELPVDQQLVEETQVEIVRPTPTDTTDVIVEDVAGEIALPKTEEESTTEVKMLKHHYSHCQNKMISLFPVYLNII